MTRRLGQLFFALSVTALSVGASACSLQLEHDVKFERNSKSLGADAARKLSEWFVERRDSFSPVVIDVHAIYDESRPKSLHLARERVKNVTKMVGTLNRTNAPVAPHIEIGAFPAQGERAFLYDRVVVTIKPVCAETNTCCPQPLKQ
jgi:hypothetical protein